MFPKSDRVFTVNGDTCLVKITKKSDKKRKHKKYPFGWKIKVEAELNDISYSDFY